MRESLMTLLVKYARYVLAAETAGGSAVVMGSGAMYKRLQIMVEVGPKPPLPCSTMCRYPAGAHPRCALSSAWPLWLCQCTCQLSIGQCQGPPVTWVAQSPGSLPDCRSVSCALVQLDSLVCQHPIIPHNTCTFPVLSSASEPPTGHSTASSAGAADGHATRGGEKTVFAHASAIRNMLPLQNAYDSWYHNDTFKWLAFGAGEQFQVCRSPGEEAAACNGAEGCNRSSHRDSHQVKGNYWAASHTSPRCMYPGVLTWRQQAKAKHVQVS